MAQTEKIIEFADVKYAKSKPTGQVQIIIHMDIGKPIIGTLHNVFFSPDLCDQLFYIIVLMNLWYNLSFSKRVLYGFNQWLKTEHGYSIT